MPGAWRVKLWAILAGTRPSCCRRSVAAGHRGRRLAGATAPLQRPPGPYSFCCAYVVYPEAIRRSRCWWRLSSCWCWGHHTAVAQPVTPWGLVQRRRARLLLAGLALYVYTLAPDILPADSGEFQTVATNLGVAHPPGFPLYTMLAHMMTRLPLGPNPAYRVNLFSALTSILALALSSAVFIVTQRGWRRPRPCSSSASPPLSGRKPPRPTSAA